MSGKIWYNLQTKNNTGEETMKKTKIIAMLLITAMTLAIAGCSEGNSPTAERTAEPDNRTVAQETAGVTIDSQANRTMPPVVTTLPPEEQEMRINTEFLEDFGLTLSELEEKYGSIVRGEANGVETDVETGNVVVVCEHATLTYFFEGVSGGYIFFVEDENSLHGIISDGTARVTDTNRGMSVEFFRFEGKVKDLFLGMERPMTVDEFNRAYRVDFTTFPAYSVSNYLSTYERGLYDWIDYGTPYHVIDIFHEKEDIIEPDSILSMQYYPGGER
jgi:hypothetical protein